MRMPCAKEASYAALGTITFTQPMHIVGIDFLKDGRCFGGYEYILVITDHFTCYTQAYATRSKSSKNVAEKFFSDFILPFGCP